MSGSAGGESSGLVSEQCALEEGAGGCGCWGLELVEGSGVDAQSVVGGARSLGLRPNEA